MALKITKKQGTGISTVEKKSQGEAVSAKTEQEDVGPAKTETPATPLCQVGLDVSYTHNMGNYESCKVSVSCSVPCSPDEMDEAFSLVEEWVNSKMEKLNAQIAGDE